VVSGREASWGTRERARENLNPFDGTGHAWRRRQKKTKKESWRQDSQHRRRAKETVVDLQPIGKTTMKLRRFLRIRLMSRMSSMMIFFLALMCIAASGVSAWSSGASSSFVGSARALYSPTTSSSHTRLSMVFERMSEDCIGAIVTAQKESYKLGLEEVFPPVLLAGVVDRPEKTKSTLQKYGITWRKVLKSLNELYPNNDKEKASLSSFFSAQKKDDLPFSKALRKDMVEASRIADQMGSQTIHSEHVLLALLEYDGETAASATTDSNVITPMKVISKIVGMDPTLTALEICEALLEDLKNQEKVEKELVTAGGASGSKSTPTLEEVGVDLTLLAQQGRLDVVEGREDEIKSCLRTLVRRRKNNPTLIGEPGVGKTAIAEGLAQIIADPSKCPPRLKGYRIVSLELSNLVAGTKYRGEFEERLQAIMKEVTDEKAPPTILFIDEIHNLVGAGSAEGGMDAANMLKPALARGELQVIGATTISEYRKYIEKDAALERRLQPLLVKEPTMEQSLRILKAIAPRYELHHGVNYTVESLEAAVKLSERYITDRFLPDKAIDLLDEAGALVHMESVIGLDDDEDVDEDAPPPQVTEHHVAEILSEWSSIPIGKLESGEMDRLRRLEDELTARVKGQSRAVRSVARAVRRSRSGLRDTRRPVASFLFCGPTGTGYVVWLA